MNNNIKYIDAPCYNCTKRTATCHATCKAYLKFYELNKTIRDDKRLHDQLNKEAINEMVTEGAYK